MIEKFEVGEVAVYTNITFDFTAECTILTEPQDRLYIAWDGVTFIEKTGYGYTVEVPEHSDLSPVFFATPAQLRKKQPPQDNIDSDENVDLKTSWDKCIWKPSEITEEA